MKPRLHPGLLVVGVILLCAAVIGGLYFFRSRQTAAPHDLLRYLPPGDSLVLSIDFAGLRRSGAMTLLAGNSIVEEPEYQAFVLETGFDFQQDLSLAILAFRENATYFLLKGKFDWPRLESYVRGQKGVCHNAFCRVQGSTPERMISMFPLRRDVMGMAVSADSWAAANLLNRNPGDEAFPLPAQPVWLSIPASYLRDAEKLPAGTRLFAKALEGSERIVLSLVAEGGNFEALLEVTCRSAEDASLLATQMHGITILLRELIAREDRAPNPRDLSGVLTAGTFRQSNLQVFGRWPLQRAFLETLAGRNP